MHVMIIDSAHLNLLLIVWSTTGYIRVIRIVILYFCDAHNSNSTTLKFTDMTKFETRMNTPQQGAIQILIEEVKNDKVTTF